MKKSYLLLLALFILALAFLQGCEHTTFNPERVIPVSYSKQVQPIFNNNCAFANCHIAGSAPSNLVLTGYQELAEGGDEGNAIIPFEPALSHLFQHLNGDSTLSPQAEPPMPFQRQRISTVLLVV